MSRAVAQSAALRGRRSKAGVAAIHPAVIVAAATGAPDGRCSQPYVPSAGKTLRYRSSPVAIGRYTALTAMPLSAQAAVVAMAVAGPAVADEAGKPVTNVLTSK